MSEIRVLAVRQPWASLIVEGLKTIEVRSKSTNIRERVAIYATDRIPREEELLNCFSTLGRYQNYKKMSKTDQEKYDKISNQSYNLFNLGRILGTVEITNCTRIGTLSSSDYEWIYYSSYAPAYMITDPSHIWRLETPVKFPQPIPYKPPKGCVVWSKTELPEGII